MSKLSKIASKGLRMFSWSQDALQESVKLKVGDEVEVIASPELLSLISIDDFEVAKGIVYYIDPDPTDNWDYDNLNEKLKDYNGTIAIRFPVEIWHFPYSHWRDFLRKVPKTTLAWSQKALEEKPFEHYVGWFVEDNTPGCASSVKYCYITNVIVARNDMVSLWGYWASNYQDVMEEANKTSYVSTFYTSLTPENVEKYIKKLHYVGPIKKSIQGSITKEAWSQDALNPQPQVGDKVRLTDDVDTLRSIGISCENCPSAPGIITYVDDDTIKIELGQIADERRFGFKMRVLIPPTNWEEFFTIVLKKEAWSQEALRDDIRVGDKVKIIGPDSLLESVSLNTSYASGAIGKVVSIFKNASYNYGVHRSYVGNITGHFLEHINGTPYQYHFPYSHWKEFLEIVDDTDKTTSLKLSWQEHLDPRSVWEGSQQMPDFFWENIPSSVRWYGDGELYYNELPDDIKSKFEAALLIWERKEKKRKRKAEEYERNFRNKRKLSWQQFRPLEAEALGFIEALERLNLDVDNTIFRKITAFLYYSYPDHSTFMHMLRLAGYEELAQEHLDLLTKIVKASRFFNHHYSDVVDAVNNHLQKLLNLKNTLNQRAVTWHVRNGNLLYEGFPQSLLTETSLKFSSNGYFIASQDSGLSSIIPEGFYERFDDYKGVWYPQSRGNNEMQYFVLSDVPEIAASKSPEGALLGAIQSSNKTGIYYVYQVTSEGIPAYDAGAHSEGMEEHSSTDFHVLEEVRYRDPIEIKKIGQYECDKALVDAIMQSYDSDFGGLFYEGAQKLEEIKRAIRSGIQVNSSLKFSKEETPSEAQLEAGNYKKKHIRKDGFDISIENDKGSTRSGTSKDGKEWSVKMKHAYGYIKGTEGKDGDHVDVIIADDYKEDQSVFIVNQTDDKGKFDEHKVCIGFLNKDDAEKAYLDNYEKGWKNYENIVEMPMEQFKQWVKDKKYTKNLAKPLKLSWKIPDLERYLKPGAVFRKQYYGSPNYQYFYIHELQRKIVNFFKTEFPENTTDDFNDSDMQQFYGIITDSGITDIIDRYNEHKFGVYGIFLSDNWMESMEYLGQIEDVVANANTVESKLAWKIHKTTYTRDEFLEVVGPYQVWTFTSDTGYMHIPFKTLDKAAFIGFDNIGRPKITDSYFKSYTDREYESGQMPFDYAVINKSWVEFELVSGTPKTSSLKFSWAIQPTEVYNLEEFLDTVKPNQIWEALGEDSGKKYFITSYKAKAEKFRLDNLSFLYMVSNAIWSDNINTVVNNRVGGIINIPLSKLPMRLIQDKSTIKQSWAIQPTIPDRIKWDDNVARQKMIGKDLVGVFNSASTFALGWNVNICKITNANWIKILEHIHLDIPSYSDALDTADEYALSHGLTRIVSPGEPGYNDIPKMAWQFPIEVGDIVETTKRITDGNADGWDLPAGKRGEVFDIESSEHKFPPYRYGIEFFMLRDRDTSRPEAWYLFDDEIKLVEKKISSLKLNTWKIVEPEIMTLAEYRSQFTDDSNRNEVWIVRNSDGDSWAVVLKEIPSERGAFFNKENLSFENAQRIGRELAVERDAIYIITDWEQVKITPSSSLKQSWKVVDTLVRIPRSIVEKDHIGEEVVTIFYDIDRDVYHVSVSMVKEGGTFTTLTRIGSYKIYKKANDVADYHARNNGMIRVMHPWERHTFSSKQSSTSSKGLRIVSWKVFNPEYLVGWDNVLNYWKQPDSNPIVISFMKRATGYITVTTWYPHMEGHRVSLGDDIFNEHAKKLQGLHMDYDDWKHIEKEFSLAKIKDALIYANELSAEYNNAPFYIIDGTSNTKGDDDIWAQEVLSAT